MILASDTQSTGFTKDSVTKVTELGSNALIACAGAESYIGLFKDHLKDSLKRNERKGTDPYKIINQAATTYREDISRIAEHTPGRYGSATKFYPEAVFGVSDHRKGNRIFQTDPDLQDPFIEVVHPLNRATAGSGGVSASVFLKSVEDLMYKVDSRLRETNWTEFSQRLVAQLCFILLRRIQYIDAYTSGQQVYLLRSSGPPELLKPIDIFNNAHEGDKVYLTVLARTIQEEIEPDKLLKLIDIFRVPSLIQKLTTPASDSP